MYKTVWTAGFAMFAMFLVWQSNFSTGYWCRYSNQWELLPLDFLTGICVPFIGMFAMILYDGNRERPSI